MTQEPEQQTPFEKRKSQNLHFGDYVRSTLFWVYLPVIAGVATLIGGRISRNHFNNKLWPLDGSPTIVQTLWEKGFGVFTKKAMNTKLEIGEVERLRFFTNHLPEEKRLNATRDIWNFLKGVELGGILLGFHVWRKKEVVRLDLEPSYDRLKKLEHLNPTDAELAADNALMEKELAYVRGERPSQRLNSSHAHHHGTVAHSAREQTLYSHFN